MIRAEWGLGRMSKSPPSLTDFGFGPNRTTNMSDKKIIIAAVILLAAVGAAAYFFGTNKNSSLALAAIKDKTEKYINANLVAPGTKVAIKNIVEEDGLYKILVNLGEQNLTAYISHDGRIFFPQAFDMDSSQKNEPASPTPTASQSIPQKDVPSVELFVMSYCPYGVQMEKGLLPAVELLGQKINFQLKFVDYSMHGDQEISENLRQYCLAQTGFKNLDNYLKCFDKQGDAAACLKETGIDAASLESCISQTDEQYKITASAKDQSTWTNGQFPPFNIYKADNVKYGVQGSPTLVINGVQVSPARDPESLLNVLCSSFTSAPAQCSQKLSSDIPSAGFGEGTGSAASTNCGK